MDANAQSTISKRGLESEVEPVSNYLLLEQYSPQRDAETWNRVLDERLAGWSVTVCQVTGTRPRH